MHKSHKEPLFDVYKLNHPALVTKELQMKAHLDLKSSSSSVRVHATTPSAHRSHWFPVGVALQTHLLLILLRVVWTSRKRLSSTRTQRARPPAYMENRKLSALLALIGGVLLILPHGLGKNVSIRLQTGNNSLSEGKVEGRPRVTRSAVSCDDSFDQFCLNNGKCMLLVDLNERHCQCDMGFYGPRCGIPEMVQGKMAKEEIILIVFCVGLLLIGLAGALYFFFKWYKKNKCLRQQKRQGYRGIQLV